MPDPRFRPTPRKQGTGMAIVNQPCYCTREMVRRALDVKQASYTNEQVDRAICSAADAVEDTTGRRFYTQYKTNKWDWPNFQYAYPWRVWLDKNELAAPATSIVSGTFLQVPVTIPISAVIFQPVNEGPPFTSIQLRRDLNYSFGNNTTPQLDIAITGPFGYWMQTRAAGSAASAIGLNDLTIQVSDGVSIGVGDVAMIDSESMIVTDSDFIDTGISYSGLSTQSKADKIVGVVDGTKFTKGEVLQVDTEWLLIENIIGNNLVVNRGWDASVLAAHTGGTIWARRVLSVIRGALGTTAAAHLINSAISISDVPSLVREYSIAEAEVWLAQEPTAYGGASAPQKAVNQSRGTFSVSQSIPGAGLPDIRDRIANSKFTRKARSRVILWLNSTLTLVLMARCSMEWLP